MSEQLEIFKQMLGKLESIDTQVDELNQNFAGIAPVIDEHSRRIAKNESNMETLNLSLNKSFQLSREINTKVNTTCKLLVGICVVVGCICGVITAIETTSTPVEVPEVIEKVEE